MHVPVVVTGFPRDGLWGRDVVDRGERLTPADATFCAALNELLRTVDYRLAAIERPDCAGGFIAWADFHRDRATVAMLEGLDL